MDEVSQRDKSDSELIDHWIHWPVPFCYRLLWEGQLLFGVLLKKMNIQFGSMCFMDLYGVKKRCCESSDVLFFAACEHWRLCSPNRIGDSTVNLKIQT